MKISIIAAVARHRSGQMVIGKGGALPWRLPEDLRRFKEFTMGCPIIMGRKTWDSIGRPLPGRLNIVVSRRAQKTNGGEMSRSLQDAANLAKTKNPREIFIIGGGQIYREALPVADKMYLTEIFAEMEGDAFFPPFDKREWQETARESNSNKEFRYDFVVYEKR